MTPRDQAVRRVVDDLAHALQVAVGLATHLRRESQTTVDDPVALETAIGRAVSALKKLQPSPGRRARR
jgi:hypothetical protein